MMAYVCKISMIKLPFPGQLCYLLALLGILFGLLQMRSNPL